MRHNQYYLVKVSDLGVQIETDTIEFRRRVVATTLKKLYGAFSTTPTWFILSHTGLRLKDSGSAKRALELYYNALISRGFSTPDDLDAMFHAVLEGQKIAVYLPKQTGTDLVQRMELIEPTNFIEQIFGEST